LPPELKLVERILIIFELFKKHEEYKTPFVLTLLRLRMLSKLVTFHNLRILSSFDIDITKSLLLILSEQCLKFVILELWAFLISDIIL